MATRIQSDIETAGTPVAQPRDRSGWREALGTHWPEYLMEATLLGAFMIVAAAAGSALEHPASPLRAAVPAAFPRRVIGGVIMGAAAIGLVHTRWGKRSGAHMNPSFTLAFFRLGKVAPWDAFFYVCGQVVGGCAGIAAASVAIGAALGHPSVNFVATVPGEAGVRVAWVAEAGISFILMLVVLGSSNSARLSRFTPWMVGALVAAYIVVESPLSGMSMNPARSLGSALPAGALASLWVYFTAPPLGMLLAAELFLRLEGVESVWCAKLHHHNRERCIFHCRVPKR